MFPAHAGMNRMLFQIVQCAFVFPAHAGMNRLRQGHHRACGGVPRARGDEPMKFKGLGSEPSRVPRARGDEPPATGLEASVPCSPRTRG